MVSKIVDKSWEVQRRVEERVKRLGRGKYGRVLQMARKPTREEYNRVVLIVALGILVVGAAGFAVYLIFQFGGPFLQGLFK